MRKTIPPEVRAKISATMTGRKYSAERRAAMSAGRRGMVFSESHLENIRRTAEARRGTRQSPESNEKRRQALKGRTRPEEVIEKIREAHLGVPMGEVHSRHVSQAKRGTRWIVDLNATQEKLIPAGEAFELVATGKWRYGRLTCFNT